MIRQRYQVAKLSGLSDGYMVVDGFRSTSFDFPVFESKKEAEWYANHYEQLHLEHKYHLPPLFNITPRIGIAPIEKENQRDPMEVWMYLVGILVTWWCVVGVFIYFRNY